MEVALELELTDGFTFSSSPGGITFSTGGEDGCIAGTKFDHPAGSSKIEGREFHFAHLIRQGLPEAGVELALTAASEGPVDPLVGSPTLRT